MVISIPHAIALGYTLCGLHRHTIWSHGPCHITICYAFLTIWYNVLRKTYQMVGIHTQHSYHLKISFQLFKHQFISSEVNSVIKPRHKNENGRVMYEIGGLHTSLNIEKMCKMQYKFPICSSKPEDKFVVQAITYPNNVIDGENYVDSFTND